VLADKKCPFTGQVSIRGRILTGTVVSTKMHRTIIIRREYLHFIPKYNRYEKRHKNLAAHVSPAFRVEEGDQVTVGQCRPLSKTVRFRRICAAQNGSKPASIYRIRAQDATRTKDKMLTLQYRSASTSSVSSPGPARLSRASRSSKRIGLLLGISGVVLFEGIRNNGTAGQDIKVLLDHGTLS